MRINSSNFRQYISLFEKKLGKSLDSKDSLYKLSNEFKDFLKNEVGVDVDNLSVDINAMLKDDIADLINSFEESENTGNTENSNENFLMGLISELFDDKDLTKSADLNGDGVIDKDEYTNFFSALNGDGDSKLSLEEVFNGIEKIKNNEISLTETPKTSSTKEDTEETNDTNSNDSVNSSTARPSSSGGSSNGDPTLNSTGGEELDEKDYSSMNKEQLEEQKNLKQSDLENYTSALQAVYNGSNEAVSSAKGEADEKKAEYDKALEEDEKISQELKQKKAENDSAIAAKEGEITELNNTILNLTSKQTSLEASINQETSTIAGLTAALSNLSAKSPTETYPQSAIDSQKATVQKQIDTHKKQLEQYKTELAQVKSDIETAQASLSTKQNEELPLLTNQRNEIEAEIQNNCGDTVKAALTDYDSARTKLETTMSEQRELAQNNLDTVKNELSQIEGLLNTKIQESEESKNSLQEYSLFDENLDISTEYTERTEDTLSSLVIGPKNPDPNIEYPTIYFVPGRMQYINPGEESMYYNTSPGGVVPNWDLKNFQGYIVVLQLEEGVNKDWNEADALRRAKNTIDKFKSTHKTGMSILSGASMGQYGVGNIGVNLGKEYFDKIDYIAGSYNGKTKKQLEEIYGRENISIHVGALDNFVKRNVIGMYENRTIYKSAGHDNIIEKLYETDANGDNKSDYIQEMFGEWVKAKYGNNAL